MKAKIIHGSTASKRVAKDLFECDLDKLAEIYSNYGNVPERLGNKKAMEIALLARAYLVYRDRDKKRYPRKSKANHEK